MSVHACPNCGTHVPSLAPVCAVCGLEVGAAPPAPSPASGPAVVSKRPVSSDSALTTPGLGAGSDRIGSSSPRPLRSTSSASSASERLSSDLSASRMTPPASSAPLSSTPRSVEPPSASNGRRLSGPVAIVVLLVLVMMFAAGQQALALVAILIAWAVRFAYNKSRG